MASGTFNSLGSLAAGAGLAWASGVQRILLVSSAMRAVEVATHRQAAYDLLTARDVWRSMQMRPEVRVWWPMVQHCPDPMAFVPAQIDAAMRQGVSDARDAREVWR